MKEKNYWILHSQWRRKQKASHHRITELNRKKKQLSIHRKNSITSYFFSLGAVTLSLLIYPVFFLVWNIFKPVSGIPVDGKHLICKVKNAALIQLNLAAEVDTILSEDKWRTTLGSFWSFRLYSSPLPAAHTAQQPPSLPQPSPEFCMQTAVSDLLTEIFLQPLCWPT